MCIRDRMILDLSNPKVQDFVFGVVDNLMTNYPEIAYIKWDANGEEEKNAADLITKMELFGGDSKGLYMLNSELKARVYTAPSLVL